jgi:surfactin synthase thioesterase subunit
MLSAIIQSYLDKPFAILGHSMGALTRLYELARELWRQSGCLPVQLSSDIRVQLFEGDHFYLNHAPQPLLQAIGTRLSENQKI